MTRPEVLEHRNWNDPPVTPRPDIVPVAQDGTRPDRRPPMSVKIICELCGTIGEPHEFNCGIDENGCVFVECPGGCYLGQVPLAAVTSDVGVIHETPTEDPR